MLNAAIISENHDACTMYPEFARVAREEGLEDVAEWFDTLSVAEGIHLRSLSFHPVYLFATPLLVPVLLRARFSMRKAKRPMAMTKITWS
jgi:hypothetical protein